MSLVSPESVVSRTFVAVESDTTDEFHCQIEEFVGPTGFPTIVRATHIAAGEQYSALAWDRVQLRLCVTLAFYYSPTREITITPASRL